MIDQSLSTLAVLLHGTVEHDGIFGAIEKREFKWVEVNTAQDDYNRGKWFLAKQIDYVDYHRMRINAYYRACDECSAIQSEIDYRRGGELLPSCD